MPACVCSHTNTRVCGSRGTQRCTKHTRVSARGSSLWLVCVHALQRVRVRVRVRGRGDNLHVSLQKGWHVSLHMGLDVQGQGLHRHVQRLMST